MDGLLLDTESIALEAFVDVAVPLGLPEVNARHEFLFFVGGDADAAKIRMQRLFPNANEQEIQRDWVKAFDARLAAGVPLRPTVAEVIPVLAKAGHKMCVVTSSSRAHAEHNLAAAGLRAAFKELVTADDVTFKKPNPEPYLKGAAALGVRPQDCFAFEDSDPGTRAAAAAGCSVWQIPDMRPPHQPFPEVGQCMAVTLLEAVHAAGIWAELNPNAVV